MSTPEHFNHARLPSWGTLDQSERYWAGYISRKVDDMALAREWYYGTSTFIERTDLDSETLLLAFLLDSLLTALTHQESKIAFRALLQAAGYQGRLGFAVNDFGNFGDAYRVAQTRVEGMIGI